MKIERTKNATRNMIFGILLKIYQMAIPFFMRTAMIYLLGVEYLGLNSLFTSILQVLNLAELGVGSAMVFGMYQAIAEDDNTKICALMKIYRIYYRIIGGVIAIIGIALTPMIPKLVNSDVPMDINIYILYLLNLGATVLTYWLFAYKSSLLQAYQRTDVVSKITIAVDTVKYIVQLLILVIFRNYYLYVMALLVAQIFTNIFTAMIVTKMYPQYRPKGHLDKKEVQEINQRIKDLFTSKLGAVIVSSVDTIVISAFLGIKVLAIYQNYYFIVTSIIGFVTIIFNSVTAGIGNSLIIETKQKNFNDFKKLTLLIVWIAAVCSCCLLNLYQPFMKIWVGNELMLEFKHVICLVLYYFIYEVNQLLNVYKDAGGIWHEDRFRPLVTAIANLSMNLILVQVWGLYGVILSTVLSMLIIGMPWLFHNIFTFLFEKNWLIEYLKKLLGYTITVMVNCIICFFVCQFLVFSEWITFFVRAIVCCIIPSIMFWLIYRKTAEFKQCVQLINNMTKGKIKFLMYLQ